MTRKAFILFFLGVIMHFSTFAVINDQTQFQLELKIQLQFSRELSIIQYSADTPISEAQDGSKTVNVSPVNSTDSIEICKISYESNVYGLNKIYLHAYPLYLLDNLGEAIADQRAGYQLDFDNQADSWSFSLEVSNAVSGNDLTIPINVPFIFENYTVQTLSRTIGVTAVFTDFEEMAAGTYRANIQIGLEAL